MWLLVTREPRPDAPEWTGRRVLAAIDAVMWPALWVLGVWQLHGTVGSVGLVGPVVTAVAVLSALGRLRRALRRNRRYRFTTWRWGKLLAALWLMGAVMKLATPA
jgi:hypothetical protein